MSLPLAAQTPDIGPMIIYLIIGAIWVIGQIARARRARKQRDQDPSYEYQEEDEAVDPAGIDPALRDFVEAVTGKKVLTEERPPPRAAPATPPLPRPVARPAPAPPLPLEIPPRPAAPAQQATSLRRPAPARRAEPAPRKRRAPVTPMSDMAEPAASDVIGHHDPYAVSEKSAQAIYGTEIGDPDDDQPLVVIGSLSALAGMEALRVAMPSFRLPTIREPDALRHPVNLGTREDIRRAMMERIVLGPPRGIAIDPEENFL